MAAKYNNVVKEVAVERIKILYALAKEEPDSEFSRKYVKLLKDISRHYKIRLDKKTKSSICKKCNTILIPGKTAKVRIASSKKYVLYTCLNCGAETHLHY